MNDGSAATPDLRLLEAFLNTLDERTFSRHGTPHAGGDELTSTSSLSTWLAEHGLLPDRTPIDDGVLAAAIQLRTRLRQILLTDPANPAATETALAGYPLHLVSDRAGRLRLSATGTSVLNPIVETVAVAVAQGRWARLKICAAPDCHWAFYDVSRNGAGRWCSMEACGNRTKTRTYRQRHHPNGGIG